MDRLDWDLGLLHLTFQISYFFLLLLVFLIYKTDIVTSLVNYIEICMENCDRILSISVIVLDIAIIIRRVKTVLCRSDIRIFSDFFFFFIDATIIPFDATSFISCKWFYTAYVTSTYRMFLCATAMNTNISQLRKKINIKTWENDDTIFNNCSIHLFWFAANL